MILTDYLRSTPDMTWDIARQCGVTHGVIRMPEDPAFEFDNPEHWETVMKRFRDGGFVPLVMEPMPDALHEHIKRGDALRDACIEQVIRMFPLMVRHGLTTICFNFMAYIGWLRTSRDIPERGGALVTGFRMEDFESEGSAITAEELWTNYTYFIKAVVPEAEKYGIRLALHPDDPPVERLGNVERILISGNALRHAVRDICPSPSLGFTMCQANYYLMGENPEELIREFADRIYLIHFRNVVGDRNHLRETFHDNGALDMPALIRTYHECGIQAPIRVDHVPTMAGETQKLAGYDALGRFYALGYLKGLLDSVGGN